MIRNPDFYKPAPKDNAWHCAPYEWWYFDAVFDNGYALWSNWYCGYPGTTKDPEHRSVDVCISTPDGMTIQMQPIFPLHETSASTKTCDGKWGENYARGGHPRWEIHFRGAQGGLDLVYENVTQGVREPPDGCFIGRIQEPRTDTYWTHVIHPRSKVSGKLIVGGNEIPVKGEGYTDHQWGNISLFDTFQWWYWGHIYLPNHTIQFFDGDFAEKWGYQRFKRMWLLKGEKAIDYVKDGIYTEASEIEMEPLMRISYARKLVQTFDTPMMYGTVTHRMKHFVRYPAPNCLGPEGTSPRAYMTWVCECDAKLEIDGQKVEAVSLNMHERSQFHHERRLVLV